MGRKQQQGIKQESRHSFARMTIARMTIARPQLQHQRLPTAGLQHRVVHVMTVLPIETLFSRRG